MRKQKKGFTVVELVVVIAIIAVLAAVLIPTFTSIIKKANDSAYLQERTNQQLQDLIEKVENQNYLTWEDFEAKLAAAMADSANNSSAKITEAVKKALSGISGASLTKEQVEKIVEKALEGQLTVTQVEAIVYNAINGISASGLTQSDVKAIVNNAIRNIPQTGVTKEQVTAAINSAIAGLNDAQKQAITAAVNSALEKFTSEAITAEDVQKIVEAVISGQSSKITLTLNKDNLSLNVGASEILVATVTPEGTEIGWLSSDKSVATVSNGTVTAVAAGNATITVTAGGATVTCAVTVTEVTIKNGLVNGYYYLNNELYTGTITDNNKTIEFENGCLVVWAEDSLQSDGPYVVNHTFNKSSVDSKYLTDKIVLSSISSVYGDPGSQTFVSNKININFEGYSVESAKACDPSIMYSLSSTPWNNATVYADYMKLISETCGNNEYGDASAFPFYISSKDYTEYQSLSVSGLTFTDYLKFKYVSNVIVTSSTTAIETYMIKNGSEDKLSAYAYDNGDAGMGIILSKDGNAYFYSWSDSIPCVPSYTNISSDGKYSGYGYSVDRNGATIVVSYNGTAIDTLTITKNVINDFNLVEQKAAISTKSIADSCSKEELLALATDLGNTTSMRIDQAPEVMELFIKAFWSTYSFSNAYGSAACSFDNFNATTLNNYSYKYVVQFVNGIGNAYQEMEHVGPIIKVIISKN